MTSWTTTTRLRRHATVHGYSVAILCDHLELATEFPDRATNWHWYVERERLLIAQGNSAREEQSRTAALAAVDRHRGAGVQARGRA